MRRLGMFLFAFFMGLLMVGVASYFLILEPFLVAYGPSPISDVQEGLEQLSMPDGFDVSIYAEIDGARSLAYDEQSNTLYVGTREEGNVYAVTDPDQDYQRDAIRVLASDLRQPNGVALRNDTLYVAEQHRILAFTNLSETGRPSFQVIANDYPDEAQHGWKFIKFGPDGHLYVPVGAPCNICNQSAPFATITKLNVSTGDFTVHARGIRNTVGFDWDPQTDDLWFTDNGRDWLGDNRPGDELNHITQPDQHFGFPFCHNRNISDPEYGDLGDCEDIIPPEQILGPHVAALGMEFYDGSQFPETYRHDVLIAEHGSWNREDPIGYRITRVSLDENRSAVSYEPFITGWLIGDRSWGRPVDVEVLPDGSLLVSDDKAGLIYRFTYTG